MTETIVFSSPMFCFHLTFALRAKRQWLVGMRWKQTLGREEWQNLTNSWRQCMWLSKYTRQGRPDHPGRKLDPTRSLNLDFAQLLTRPTSDHSPKPKSPLPPNKNFLFPCFKLHKTKNKTIRHFFSNEKLLLGFITELKLTHI